MGQGFNESYESASFQKQRHRELSHVPLSLLADICTQYLVLLFCNLPSSCQLLVMLYRDAHAVPEIFAKSPSQHQH